MFGLHHTKVISVYITCIQYVRSASRKSHLSINYLYSVCSVCITQKSSQYILLVFIMFSLHHTKVISVYITCIHYVQSASHKSHLSIYYLYSVCSVCITQKSSQYILLVFSMFSLQHTNFFSSSLQIWYVELWISWSISESPLDFKITRGLYFHTSSSQLVCLSILLITRSHVNR